MPTADREPGGHEAAGHVAPPAVAASPGPVVEPAALMASALAAGPRQRRAIVGALQRSAGNAAVGRLARAVLARDASPVPAIDLPRGATFAELLARWRSVRWSSSATAAEQREAAAAMVHALNDVEETMRHGIDIVRELFEEDLTDLAVEALDRVESAWRLRDVIAPRDNTPEEIRRASVPGAGIMGSFEARLLMTRAERAARDDDHVLVSQLLTRAALMIQMQLIRETTLREATLNAWDEQFAGARDQVETLASITRTMFTYTTVQSLYNQLREIMAFYPSRERQRRVAGDPQGAARMHTLGTSLRDEIRTRFTVSGHAMVAEVTRVDTPRGPALRMHGANFAENDLTQLPGLPSPREIGGHTYQWQESAQIMQALAGQVDLVEELRADPEVAREFPDGTIDMANERQRLRAWTAMLRSLRASSSDDGAALTALVRLMERYLRAFTIHTQYNIRDFGTNYLDSTFPSDLAGRAERDCGVYAVTLAFDLYRIARAASPRLSLRFELMSMPEHVSLVIHDTARDRFFIGNNDAISGPFTGSVEAQVARLYVGIRGHQNMVVPAMNVELGSTTQGERQFRSGVWERYQDAVSWEIASPPGQREETYRALYELEQEFDRGTSELEAGINALAASRAGDERQRLETGLGQLARRYRRLGSLFAGLGPGAPITLDARRRGILERMRGRKRFLFHSATAGAPHPLARAAMALLRLEHLGTALAPEDAAFVAGLRRIDEFRNQLDAYAAAGFPSVLMPPAAGP